MSAEKPEDEIPEIEIEIEPAGEATPADSTDGDDLPPVPDDDDLPPIPGDDEPAGEIEINIGDEGGDDDPPPPPPDDDLSPVLVDDEPEIEVPVGDILIDEDETDTGPDEDPGGGPIDDPPPPANKLTLSSESGQELTLKVTTDLGVNNCKQMGDEARFMDAKQMTLEKSADGWRVIPNTSAPNETMLNDKSITDPQILNDGDTLAVGRESKGVIKMPMTVRLA